MRADMLTKAVQGATAMGHHLSVWVMLPMWQCLWMIIQRLCDGYLCIYIVHGHTGPT